MHDDRVRAVVRGYRGKVRVVGVELFGKSSTYDWVVTDDAGFEKITLFPERDFASNSIFKTASAIIKICRQVGAQHIFFCNYEKLEIFLAALLLRLLGKKTYMMANSKYDDKTRSLFKEVAKSLFLMPYMGAISNETRSADYMRFLGVNARKIASPYNTLSLAEIRRLSAVEPAPAGALFADRHFTIVARFVPEKNLPMAIDAYARYCQTTSTPRKLQICGSGKLEPMLRSRVSELGLDDKVIFRGFLQRDGVAQALGQTLALILPSIDETFGNVVIEAQAMGLPVLLSETCGAHDTLVRTGVNGFVFEPDNSEGLAFFMGLLDRDEALWRRMCISASTYAEKGDVDRFAEAIMSLVPVS